MARNKIDDDTKEEYMPLAKAAILTVVGIIAIVLGNKCQKTAHIAPKVFFRSYPKYAATFVAIGPGRTLAIASELSKSALLIHLYLSTISC